MLTDVEREHLFLLGLGRPPEVRYRSVDGVTPRLQRLLDALEVSPAIVKTATWDVVAWNRAAAARADRLWRAAARQRNILRLMFGDAARPRRAARLGNVARLSSEPSGRMPRAPAPPPRSRQLVDELCRLSPEFEAMWRDNDVSAMAKASSGSAIRISARSSWNISAFAVDGRPDWAWSSIIPPRRDDAARIRAFLADRSI